MMLLVANFNASALSILAFTESTIVLTESLKNFVTLPTALPTSSCRSACFFAISTFSASNPLISSCIDADSSASPVKSFQFFLKFNTPIDKSFTIVIKPSRTWSIRFSLIHAEPSLNAFTTSSHAFFGLLIALPIASNAGVNISANALAVPLITDNALVNKLATFSFSIREPITLSSIPLPAASPAPNLSPPIIEPNLLPDLPPSFKDLFVSSTLFSAFLKLDAIFSAPLDAEEVSASTLNFIFSAMITTLYLFKCFLKCVECFLMTFSQIYFMRYSHKFIGL